MKEKKNSIWKSAALVTIMMLAFKILGFAKQAVMASYYGATIDTDIYYIGWGFISGVSEAIVKAISVSLIAIYTSLRVQKGKDEAAKLINGILEIFIPIFLVLIGLIIILAPLISRILAPSYNGYEYNELIKYLRILAPVMLFACLELVFGAVLDSHKSFFVPRLQSFIYSVCVILACIFFSSLLGVSALVMAQYVSSVIFTILIILAAKKYHNFFLVKIKEIPELKHILLTAIPLFIGNSAIQINKIVDKSIASGLGAGTTSALSYCIVLEQLVTSIMIVNIGNVMFANFSEYAAKNDKQLISDNLSKAINILICLLMGITVITVICAEDIVKIVYFRGNFNYSAVSLTSVALIGYAVSFVPIAVRDLSIKTLYAFKDTRRAMYASLISIVVNISTSILLAHFFGIIGITLGTSIASVVGMIINAFSIKKYLNEYRYSDHIKLLIRCIPATIVLGVSVYLLKKFLNINLVIQFIIICIVGFGLYFLVLKMSKIKEVDYAYSFVAAKLKKIKRN